ncbi:hypothetical protein GMSM_31140 [Geomonas sp. Red276]
MKKIFLAVFGLVMMTATAARAEHKLLVTDILDPKQVEAQATLEYTHAAGNLGSPADGTGKVYYNTTESLYSVGVGIIPGFEMTASIPYLFNERAKVEMPGLDPELEQRDGFGDFALQGKFHLLGGEEERYAVVGGLGLKFDTAGKGSGGTGTTDVSPFVAASYKLNRHHTPYAIYRATIRNNGEQDTHTLTLGVEKEINETFTLDAKFDANFNTATSKVTANEDFDIEAAPYIQVAHNFYLIPSVAYVWSTDVSDKETGAKVKDVDGVRLGFSLYYLF